MRQYCPLTRPRFFPLRDLKDIMDRKALIMTEFGTRFEDHDLVLDLMYYSELAYSRREERRKAMGKGNQYI